MGFFLVRSRQFPRTRAGSCENLRTSPVSLSTDFWPLSTLSQPLFSPASPSENASKSAKAAICNITNQSVTRGRINAVGLQHWVPKGIRCSPMTSHSGIVTSDSGNTQNRSRWAGISIAGLHVKSSSSFYLSSGLTTPHANRVSTPTGSARQQGQFSSTPTGSVLTFQQTATLA